MRRIARIGREGDARPIRRKSPPVMDHRGIVGQCARRRLFLRRIDQPELLALVTAAIDAVDQPVIRRTPPQQCQLLVEEGQLPRGAGCQIQRPRLRQADATQVEQCPPVAGKHRAPRSADTRVHFWSDPHPASPSSNAEP